MNNRLRVMRAERRWSQADLAQRLEVSRQSINAIETGKYDPSDLHGRYRPRGRVTAALIFTKGVLRLRSETPDARTRVPRRVHRKLSKNPRQYRRFVDIIVEL